MRKILCFLLTVFMVVSVIPISAAALEFAPDSNLPTLSTAPQIDTVFSDDDDNGTRVKLTYTNSEEMTELFREMERFAGSEKYIEELTGYENSSVFVSIQFAYKFNNNTAWVNDMDCGEYELYVDYDADGDGTNEYEYLPSDLVDSNLVNEETLIDFATYVPEYHDAAVPEAMGQGCATRKDTTDDSTGYQVNFNTNKVHVKARYRIYVSYNEDKYIDYSEWSEPVSYGNGAEFTYDDSLTADAPALELLRSEGNDFTLAIKHGNELKSILSSYFALRENDELEAFYGSDINKYANYYFQLRVNDGEWMHYDTQSYENTIFDIEAWEISKFFEDKDITPQAGDTVQLRTRLLSNNQTDDSSPELYFPAEENAYIHTDYSEPIYLPFGGVYRIIYHLNDGDFVYEANPVESFDVDSDEVIALTGTDYTPEKDGYEFAGWYTSETFEEGTKIESIDTADKRYVDLYAKWTTPGEYTVTYVSDRECSNGNPKMYTPLMDDITLDEATATGFEFLGWYTSKTFEEASKITAIDVSQAKNLTLYAKWKVPEFAITYVLDGGTNSKKNPASFTAENMPTLAAPEKLGYEFDGWYYDKKLSDKLTESNNGWALSASDNVTVYAKWIVGKWSIDYVQPAALKGAYNENPTVYTYGSPVTLKALSADGYKFNGWFTDSAFKNKAVGVSATDRGNKTYYASWTENSYSVTYVLDADPLNTPEAKTITNANPVTRLYTQKITVVPPVTTDGSYRFIGWYDNVNFYGEPVADVLGNSVKNVTLYAKWIHYMWGDADFSGDITAADARTVLRCAVMLDTLPEDILPWCNLDLSEDGALTAGDARLVLRMSVKLDTVASLKLPNSPV